MYVCAVVECETCVCRDGLAFGDAGVSPCYPLNAETSSLSHAERVSGKKVALEDAGFWRIILRKASGIICPVKKKSHNFSCDL